MAFLMPVVDRSRFSLSWGRCQRARFLNYHSGNGFGVRRKAQSLPLATGIQVHEILEGLFRLPANSPREAYREVITKSVAAYREKTEKSEILQLAEEVNSEDNKEALLLLIEEQAALIEGLGWAAVRVVLPTVFAQYIVVDVEQEEEWVLGCTCGLGSGVGTGDEHEAKECGGTVLMSRPDLLLRRNSDQTLVYVEFKTAGDVDSFDWRKQWEGNVQLAVGTAGSERRLGEEVPNCFVLGFNKGWRKRGYNTEDRAYTGPKRQNSIFCYAYRKEANPPLWEEQWATKYDYKDEQGKNRKLGKEWQKVGVWQGDFTSRPEGWTKMEFWVEGLDLEELESQIAWVGPIPTPKYLVGDLLEALETEEARWGDRLWRVWEAKDKGEAEFHSALNKEVPQSFECHRFGKECQFLSVCKKEPGWQEVILGQGDTSKWVGRRPHHQRELVMMQKLNLPIPNEDGEIED